MKGFEEISMSFFEDFKELEKKLGKFKNKKKFQWISKDILYFQRFQ